MPAENDPKAAFGEELPDKNFGGARYKVKHSGRYDTSGFAEGQFEPNSQGRVLRNLIGMKRKREMNAVESAELIRTTEKLISVYDRNHRFKAEDLCNMHKEWLGCIYEWAGNYRRVNLAKGGFLFAAAHVIPKLMGEFEQRCLAVYTPCRMAAENETIQALAVVHVELLLIHPFREGNGRLARLLASLMALQAGLPLLDFSILKGNRKQEYFSAIQSGLDHQYGPMEKIFGEVIERTLRPRRRRFSRPGSF
jgi:cell filamentation protein